jgi:hypothetical protein
MKMTGKPCVGLAISGNVMRESESKSRYVASVKLQAMALLDF